MSLGYELGPGGRRAVGEYNLNEGAVLQGGDELFGKSLAVNMAYLNQEIELMESRFTELLAEQVAAAEKLETDADTEVQQLRTQIGTIDAELATVKKSLETAYLQRAQLEQALYIAGGELTRLTEKVSAIGTKEYALAFTMKRAEARARAVKIMRERGAL